MGKFKCTKCDNEINCSKFRTVIKNGKLINIDLSTNKEIVCKCGSEMTFQPIEGEFESTNYGKFSAMSPLERQKTLRKRSQEDAKKQKYVDAERERCYYNG